MYLEAVLIGTLLLMWPLEVRQGAWKEDCWNEATTPGPVGSVERGWDK